MSTQVRGQHRSRNKTSKGPRTSQETKVRDQHKSITNTSQGSTQVRGLYKSIDPHGNYFTIKKTSF